MVFLFVVNNQTSAQEKVSLPEENFYNKSLHYTNRGIEYLYSKENGGLERLTVISASELGCTLSKCHVKSCDACHLKFIDGKSYYSLDPAKELKVCKNCHSSDEEGPDVHVKKGMGCMDCHSKREIHGDGIAYNTYSEKGFFDTKCENCHKEITLSLSHTVHHNKLECRVCHTSDGSACFNCHIDTRIKEKKSKSIPLKNVFFLINKDDKVSLANILTYVYQGKTMITVAPVYFHSIIREGKKCGECHNTKIVNDIKSNTFEPFSEVSGEFKNAEGVIPVYDLLNWNISYFNYENGKWTKIEDPGKPLLNYSGYCGPLTQEQFEKLQTEHNNK